MKKELQKGEELLREYGLHGLSEIIAAGMVKAKSRGPRGQKAILRITIREVCRIAIEQGGMDPYDLCDVATMILEMSTTFLKERDQKEKQKQDEIDQQEAEEFCQEHGL